MCLLLLQGNESREEMHGVLSKSWGAMCLSWTPVDPLIVVDTSNKIVVMPFNAVLDVTGGLDGESNPNY